MKINSCLLTYRLTKRKPMLRRKYAKQKNKNATSKEIRLTPLGQIVRDN